jgi:hypothetical protein
MKPQHKHQTFTVSPVCVYNTEYTEMSKQVVWYAAAAVALAGAPAVAQDNAEFCDATGHYYEVIAGEHVQGISWTVARDAAAQLSRNGVQGHLATLTSAGEDACVDQIRANTLGDGPAQVWIGGFQSDGAVEPGGGWQWLNDEGSIPGVNGGEVYANWANLEPNNSNGLEHHLALGRFGTGLGWNDEGTAPDSILGYVVEFGDTTAAQNCFEVDGVGGGFGCNITGAMNLELNDGSTLPPGATITQNLLRPDVTDPAKCTGEFAFPDPRVGVDGRPIANRELDVFAELGGGEPGALILDTHTYGSPCFAVIEGGANFELVDTLPGTGLKAIVATTTQIPEAVPGIGKIFGCLGELNEAGTINRDLQTSTQSTYQTDDRNLMVEMSAAAMTNHCNSPSRQATFKFSYYVLNTHEDCGLDILIDGKQAVRACFQALAVAKFDALDIALLNAADNLQKPKFSTLSSQLNQARSMIAAGQYAKGKTRLETLLASVTSATWTADSDNDPGNLFMRIVNLIYRIEQLQRSMTL